MRLVNKKAIIDIIIEYLDPRDLINLEGRELSKKVIMSNKKLITLKEASEISGYSPDYVGQLIRQGKLPGQKVYSNISWMTTEESVLSYANKSNDGSNFASRIMENTAQAGRRFVIKMDPFRIYKFLINFSIVASVLLFFLIFYIFSTAVDNKIEQKALQSASFNKIKGP